MWKNCFNFSGYTNRKDFVYSCVVNLLIGILLLFVDIPYLVRIINVICGIPFISLSVRRLRDCGRSWKWLLLVFTGIGAIVPAVMLLCCKSVEHEETEITSEEQKIDATSEKVRINKISWFVQIILLTTGRTKSPIWFYLSTTLHTK